MSIRFCSRWPRPPRHSPIAARVQCCGRPPQPALDGSPPPSSVPAGSRLFGCVCRVRACRFLYPRLVVCLCEVNAAPMSDDSHRVTDLQCADTSSYELEATE